MNFNVVSPKKHSCFRRIWYLITLPTFDLLSNVVDVRLFFTRYLNVKVKLQFLAPSAGIAEI